MKAHQLNMTFAGLVRLALETLLLEPKSSFDADAFTMWFKGLDDSSMNYFNRKNENPNI